MWRWRQRLKWCVYKPRIAGSYQELEEARKASSWSFQSEHSPAAAAKSLQSCPTLCDPIDGSPLGSSVPGILQARTVEWVAISFSNAWKWKVKVKSLSRAWLLVTPWTAAYQAPLSMDFPGKSTGVGCHCLLVCYMILNGNRQAFKKAAMRPSQCILEKWKQLTNLYLMDVMS